MPANSEQPRKSHERKKRKKRTRSHHGGKKRSPVLLGFLFVLAVLLLFLAICVIRAVLRRTSSAGSSAAIVSSGETVPENDYDSESFETDSDGIVTYEDESYYSVLGIDVSSHQGDIDWEAIAQEGVSFVILRIGYRGYTAGGLNADEAFSENLTGAQENGILVGAYFYSQAVSAEEALEEAEYTLSLLDGAALDLPVFYDWEMQTADGSRTLDVDESILTDCAAAFCQAIEAGGYDAGVYFYSSLALDTYDLTQLLSYDFWLSQPGETPDFDYVFTYWQYSYTGSLDGIDGDVDLDMMLVSAETEETDADAGSEEETGTEEGTS